MAVFRTKDGKFHKVDHERGLEMWLILRGFKQANDVQKQFLSDVKNVYLDVMWHDDIPEAYYKEHMQAIKSISMANWLCTPSGASTQPPPPYTDYNKRLWELARKYHWLNPLAQLEI